ncbi:hypothetical protein IU449_25270 [Nocardia higoensis]|uniref:DUF3137 domain-containing protein n=1 Tax=Nocardia higoensis TaxID=228599 RepID=A0ABS0DJQ4_9NOCA|nr:hypothetical protein [Nocardia higoensis]MBF6357812.1 hypothetical protein [Nocardia higoensis]
MWEAVLIALVVFVGVLAVAGLFVFLPLLRRSDHRVGETFARWAAAHGWHYDDRAHPAWTARLPGHQIGTVVFTLTGVVDNRPVTAAEYRVESHRFTVLVVHLDRPYPPLAVLDRDLSREIGDAFAGSIPIHTGDAAFDRRFRVSAVDQRYARLMLDPVVVRAQLDGPVERWSLAGRDLLTYTLGRPGNPAVIPDLARPVLHLADLLEERAFGEPAVRE